MKGAKAYKRYFVTVCYRLHDDIECCIKYCADVLVPSEKCHA